MFDSIGLVSGGVQMASYKDHGAPVQNSKTTKWQGKIRPNEKSDQHFLILPSSTTSQGINFVLRQPAKYSGVFEMAAPTNEITERDFMRFFVLYCILTVVTFASGAVALHYSGTDEGDAFASTATPLVSLLALPGPDL